MLCYRCGSHVPDTAESCPTCGQKLAAGGVRQATATFSRKRPATGQFENAPYKPGDVVAERYTIKDVVGAGPLGFVFRARDATVDVDVALKFINPRLVQTPDERKHFQKVLRNARKLSHGNLVRVYEEGEEQERPYYTMQFVEGLTLRKIIDLRIGKGSFFTLREVEPILAQICSALDSAHKVGPHSDMRPENVVVLPDLLKVSDWGVGLAMPRLPFVQALKARKGDRYLAPEYTSGGEMDHRADIYSVATIVGEMLSGLVPDGAVPELQQRNPEVPPAMEGLYRKALNSNPLARPKSAGAFYEEFAEITRRTSPPPMKPRSEVVSAVPSGGRPRPPVAGMGALEPRRKSDSKPPPPVPDEALDEREVTQSEVRSLPGTDATQRVDQAEIETRSGRAEQRSDETQIIPTVPPPPPDDVSAPIGIPPYEETGVRRVPRRSMAAVWLVLLTISGLGLGGAGGYLLLQRMKQPTAAVVEDDVKPDQTPDAAVVVAPNDTVTDEQRRAEEARKLAEANAAAEAAKKAEEEKKRLDAIAAAKKAEEDKKKADADAAAKKAADAKLAVATKSNPRNEGGCADGMRFITTGSFKMGTSGDDPMRGFDERNLASVEVPGFCIDVYEYPNRRNAAPTVNVSWNDAKRICEGKGKRLCSEAEWEKACKGPGNARFPYGNQFDPNACNTEDDTGEDRSLAGAGRFPKCRSGFGIADMSGNVAEWTATPYAANQDKTQKGGAFDRPDYAARCSARKNGGPNSRSPEVGFRCCADATP